MTEEQQKDAASTAPEADSRKQLLQRALAAGGLIALLLGALAVFDRMSRPAPPVEARLPVATNMVQAPVKPLNIDAPPEATKAVVEEEMPSAVPPAPPAPPEEATPPVEAAPPKRERPVVAVPPRPSLPVPATAPAPAPVAPAPAVAAPPAPRPAATPPQAAPAPRSPAATPAPAQPPRPAAAPAETGPIRAYALQLGVFSNVANAEQLRAKLTLNGIPSQVEVRVKLGPFANREEAMTTQTRLRALGLDAGVLVAIRH